MLWKMLHRVDRFPTSFAFLIFLGTAERFSVCLKPAPLLGARMAAPCRGSDGLFIPCRAADVLAPILTPGNCAKLCLPHKGILNGARVRVICAKRLVWFSMVITVLFWRLLVMTKLAGNSKRYNMLLTYDKAGGEEMKWKWVRSGWPGLKQFPVVPGSI